MSVNAQHNPTSQANDLKTNRARVRMSLFSARNLYLCILAMDTEETGKENVAMHWRGLMAKCILESILNLPPSPTVLAQEIIFTWVPQTDFTRESFIQGTFTHIWESEHAGEHSSRTWNSNC